MKTAYLHLVLMIFRIFYMKFISANSFNQDYSPTQPIKHDDILVCFV